MTLDYMEMKNLFSFENAVITLDSSGNKILILGINNDDPGMDSNGSGKSAIFGSIYWILFGKLIDKRDSDSVLRIGSDKGSGVIHLDNIVIKRTTDSSGKKSLSMEEWISESDCNNLTASTNTKTQEVINKIMGCDDKTFLHSQYMSSDFSTAFIGKDTTPKERFEVFEKFIDSDTYNRCIKFCDDKCKTLKQELSTLEGQYEGYNTILERHNKQELEAEYTEAFNNISMAEIEMAYLAEQKSISDLQKEDWIRYNANKVNIDKLKDYTNKLDELSHEIIPDDNSEDIETITKKMGELNTILRGEVLHCPKCKIPLCLEHNELIEAEDIDKESTEKERDKLHSDWKELSTKQETRQNKLNTMTSLTNKIITINDTIDKSIKEVEFDQEIYDELKEKIRSKQPLLNGLYSKKTEIEQIIKNIENAEQLMGRTAENMHIIKNNIEGYSFWRIGFGNIKTRCIETIIPLFESETNNILREYFDTPMSIKFTTTKELKSGGSKTELNISVEDSNGSIRGFESFSMGEKSRLAIAVTLARRNIFGDQSKLDFILIDELLDGLDLSGQNKFVEVINSLPYQVLIISHSDIFKSVFINNITVEKENGISKIVGA